MKTFPIIAIHSLRSSEFDAARRNIFVLEKTVAIVNFNFRAIDNGGLNDGCRNGGRKQWRKEREALVTGYWNERTAVTRNLIAMPTEM